MNSQLKRRAIEEESDEVDEQARQAWVLKNRELERRAETKRSRLILAALAVGGATVAAIALYMR